MRTQPPTRRFAALAVGAAAWAIAAAVIAGTATLVTWGVSAQRAAEIDAETDRLSAAVRNAAQQARSAAEVRVAQLGADGAALAAGTPGMRRALSGVLLGGDRAGAAPSQVAVRSQDGSISAAVRSGTGETFTYLERLTDGETVTVDPFDARTHAMSFNWSDTDTAFSAAQPDDTPMVAINETDVAVVATDARTARSWALIYPLNELAATLSEAASQDVALHSTTHPVGGTVVQLDERHPISVAVFGADTNLVASTAVAQAPGVEFPWMTVGAAWVILGLPAAALATWLHTRGVRPARDTLAGIRLDRGGAVAELVLGSAAPGRAATAAAVAAARSQIDAVNVELRELHARNEAWAALHTQVVRSMARRTRELGEQIGAGRLTHLGPLRTAVDQVLHGRRDPAAVELRRCVANLGDALDAFVAGTAPAGHQSALGLAAALNAVADTVTTADFGAHIRVFGDTAALGAEEQDIIVSWVRELLTNARKHSCGSEAAATLTVSPTATVIEVLDDGVGMSHAELPQPRPDSRYGLWRLRQTVQLVGGEFTWGSGAHGGARFTIALPAPAVRHADTLTPFAA